MTCFLLWVSSSSWLQNNQAFFLHVDLPQNMKIFVLLLPKDFTLHSSRSLAMWLHWKGKWVVFLTASPVLTLIHSVASEILHFAKTIPRRNPVTFIASNLTFLRIVEDRLTVLNLSVIDSSLLEPPQPQTNQHGCHLSCLNMQSLIRTKHVFLIATRHYSTTIVIPFHLARDLFWQRRMDFSDSHSLKKWITRQDVFWSIRCLEKWQNILSMA